MIDRKLIDKFYEGKCTPEEVQQVLDWFENQEEGKRHIEKYWHVFSRGYDTQPHPHQSRYLHPNTPRPISAFWRNQWLRVAAILLLGFSLALLLSTYEKLPESTTPVAVMAKETLAGQKTTFQLPDGSLVTLNAESQLTYPENFDETTRKVTLTGEAFFDVTENPGKPFIVSAGGVNTQALGTSFNVRAYHDEAHVEVILATGQVKVNFAEGDSQSTVYLLPGEKAIAIQSDKSLQQTEANLAYALGWKDNILHFREATAEQVFTTLKKWYGVDINFLGSEKDNDWQFTGEFRSENLENVLTSIGYAKNFQFKIQDKSVTITY